MDGNDTVKNMMNKMKFWVKKQLVKSFFHKKAVIKLAGATNSSVQNLIGTEVRLRWLEKGVMISIIQENISKCERNIITSQIQDIKREPDCVTLFTKNSSYEFRRYR